MNKPGREISLTGSVHSLKPCSRVKKRRQYLLPYFIPGIRDVQFLIWLHLLSISATTAWYTEQVQDCHPDTDEDVSSCMYYTGSQPIYPLNQLHVPRGQEKKIQRALMQYRDPKNHGLVTEGTSG